MTVDWAEYLNGVFLGAWLAILVGPLLFAMVQTALEHGMKAGFSVAAGIWLSDLLFIVICYFGVTWITALIHTEHFETITALLGAICLFVTGGSMIMDKKRILNKNIPRFNSTGMARVLKGFSINTFNPFTVFFWTGVMAISVESDKSHASVESLVAGIFSTIIITDSLKVIFAYRLNRWLTPRHIFLVRKVAGIALILFGLILLVRYVIL